MILGPAGSSVGTLRIPVTRDRDAGIYTCRALNEIGEASAEIRLEVGREWPLLGFPALHSHSFLHSIPTSPCSPVPTALLLSLHLATAGKRFHMGLCPRATAMVPPEGQRPVSPMKGALRPGTNAVSQIFPHFPIPAAWCLPGFPHAKDFA